MSFPTLDDLCARCGAIDFNAIQSEDVPEQESGERLVAWLGSLAHLQPDSACSFCRFLHSCTKQWIGRSRHRHGDFALYSIYPRRLHEFISASKEHRVLCIAPADRKDLQSFPLGYVGDYLTFRTSPTVDSKRTLLKGRVIDPIGVDYAVLKEWLLRCRSSHKICCSKEPVLEPDPLTLINCLTRKLENPTTQHPYLALSYVWGQQSQEKVTPLESNRLPLYLPTTVKDAITVTRSLGYTYLWVDKYCINQAHEKQKIQQIRQMDLIYSNADLTIVDGEGNNSAHGLSGVSSAHRSEQLFFQKGEHSIVSLKFRLPMMIKRAPWMSRGWTLQEALLSRRLLIFTRDQVYFECHQTNFWETIDMLGDSWDDNIILHHEHLQGRFLYILDLLADYTRRQLSREDDILNAITGVLRAHERSEKRAYHHYGVAILPLLLVTKIGRKLQLKGVGATDLSSDCVGSRVALDNGAEAFRPGHGLGGKSIWRSTTPLTITA
jgi:hypothetical protein